MSGTSKQALASLLDCVWFKPLSDAMECQRCSGQGKHFLSTAGMKAAESFSSISKCPICQYENLKLDLPPSPSAIALQQKVRKHLPELIERGFTSLENTIPELYKIDSDTDKLRETAVSLIKEKKFDKAIPLLNKLINFLPNILILRYSRIVCLYNSGSNDLEQMKEDAQICNLKKGYRNAEKIKMMLLETGSRQITQSVSVPSG